MTRSTPIENVSCLCGARRAVALLLALLVLSGLAWVHAAAATPTWLPTGGLSGPRHAHTATLLSDGRVLVAGGHAEDAGDLGTAEVYDPATGTWSATGNLSQSRRVHSATRLSDGRVLIAGGYADSLGNLRSAEVYDPASGTWSTTGPLASARHGHTATLLPDGRVLVAGGFASTSESVKSAEVYDPATGVWGPTGVLALRRGAHSATLLPDGRVLVAGGWNTGTGSYPRRTEIYDPASGTWSLSADLAVGRYHHTATLLPDGRVLVAGGYHDAALASAEVYEPTTEVWSPTGALATGRASQSATLLPDGRVLVAAGYNGDALTSAEIYDPASGTWGLAANDLAAARYHHTATLLSDGRVLVAAGYNAGTLTELYDPAAPAWARTGSIAGARYNHTATLLPDGRVLIAAGAGDYGQVQASAKLYNPATGTWAATGDLQEARYIQTATLLSDGRVLVAGGCNGSHMSGAEVYAPTAGTWGATGSLNVGRCQHSATLLANGRVLVVGGSGDGDQWLASAEVYDPATGAWSLTGGLAAARLAHTATLLPDGRLLVAGGVDADGATLRRAEVYNPATGTWRRTGNLIGGRAGHSATLLPDGRVLVAGGEGPYTGPRGLRTAEVYDPATGTWTATGNLAIHRGGHTATLLPSGRVLVAGGVWGYIGDPYYYPRGTEVYDPATGVWSSGGNVFNGRYAHSATLLLDGRVLLAGGLIGHGGVYQYPLRAEVYDRGLGFDPSWRPVLTEVSDPARRDQPLEIRGTGLRGLSQGSSGNVQDSATNYPLVQLRRMDNEQVTWLSPDPDASLSDTEYESAGLPDLPLGPTLVTLFANAIPSEARLVEVAAEPALRVSFTAATQTVGEGVGTAILTVQLSRPSSHSISVPYTVGGTATGGGVDYNLPASPLVIPAGATSATLSLTVVNDTLDETNETVVVTLQKPSRGTKQAPAVHRVTITDDDPS